MKIMGLHNLHVPTTLYINLKRLKSGGKKVEYSWSRICGFHNVSQQHGLPRPVKATVLHFTLMPKISCKSVI
jgi:hypothetical protein